MAFKERGINLTQARISDVVVIGQPTAKQLAYDGYRSNIEAFLHATATKKITTAEGSVYSIPSSYLPSVPLPLPQVIFRLAKKTFPESLKFMLDGLEPYGVQRVEVGKGGTELYTCPACIQASKHEPPNHLLANLRIR